MLRWFRHDSCMKASQLSAVRFSPVASPGCPCPLDRLARTSSHPPIRKASLIRHARPRQATRPRPPHAACQRWRDRDTGSARLSPSALAQQGLKLGVAEAFGFEGLKARARDLAAKPYQAVTAPGRCAGADRLRRAWQDQVQAGDGAVGERPLALAGDLLPSRPLLPEAGADACARRRPGARDHL
jgi:hypothetical protein